MKNIFITLALFISTTVFADTQGVLTYKVVQAQFAVQHAHKVTDADVILNYDAKNISLKIEKAFYCAPGLSCSQVMPLPLEISLPIVSIKTDRCGVHTVIAELDNRMTGGSLEQLTVKDVSDMNCMTIDGASPEATYVTSHFDRQTNQDVTDTSTMTLELISKN